MIPHQTLAHLPTATEEVWRLKHELHAVQPFEVLRPGVYQRGFFCQGCNARLYTYAGPRKP